MLIEIGQIAGGIGLFLLAVRMISDGLTVAAGNSLRNFLSRATKTPLRGILAGATITSLVQSSSAVTVAIIGFVNAGILTLYQALGIVFGANIGTTMTGWLVTMIGLNVKLDLFALPMIGVGMLLNIVARNQRARAIGQTLVGFGLFFLGIEILKNTFGDLASTIDLTAQLPSGILGLVMYFALGFLITLLTQSSSAAIAIILTAVTSGAFQFDAAASMVIGANVGTTSTAAIAVIGATSNAKRVALAHIIFNVATATVALLIMPLMIWLVKISTHAFGLTDTMSVSLALFHTIFNILGVLLIWPLTHRLGTWLKHRFVSHEENESRPKHLDSTTLGTPTLAINAAAEELTRIMRFCLDLTKSVLTDTTLKEQPVREILSIIENLLNEVRNFVTLLEQKNLSAEVANQLPIVMRTTQYFHSATMHATFILEHHASLETFSQTELREKIHLFLEKVVVQLQMEIDITEEVQRQKATAEILEIYHNLKRDILTAGSSRNIPAPTMVSLLELMSQSKNMFEQITKGITHLDLLKSSTKKEIE